MAWIANASGTTARHFRCNLRRCVLSWLIPGVPQASNSQSPDIAQRPDPVESGIQRVFRSQIVALWRSARFDHAIGWGGKPNCKRSPFGKRRFVENLTAIISQETGRCEPMRPHEGRLASTVAGWRSNQRCGLGQLDTPSSRLEELTDVWPRKASDSSEKRGHVGRSTPDSLNPQRATVRPRWLEASLNGETGEQTVAVRPRSPRRISCGCGETAFASKHVVSPHFRHRCPERGRSGVHNRAGWRCIKGAIGDSADSRVGRQLPSSRQHGKGIRTHIAEKRFLPAQADEIGFCQALKNPLSHLSTRSARQLGTSTCK